MSKLIGYEHGFGWDSFLFRDGQSRQIRVVVGWGLLAPQITRVFVVELNGHDQMIHEWTNENMMALDAIRRVDNSSIIIPPWLAAVVCNGGEAHDA